MAKLLSGSYPTSNEVVESIKLNTLEHYCYQHGCFDVYGCVPCLV